MSGTHAFLELATPVPAAVAVYTVTAARVWATAAALLGLAGAIIGGRVFARVRRRPGAGGRTGALVALTAGLVAVAGGVVNLAVADGGPGTGNGVVGGGVAVVAGLVAAVFGGLALSPGRRAKA